MTIFILFAGN